MEKDTVFFGSKGMTSTSANHIANLAKEYYQSLETKLNNISFYETEMSLISSNESKLVSRGQYKSDLETVADGLEAISKCKALIAWIREAIREKEKMLSDVEQKNIEEYAKDNGMTLPTLNLPNSVDFVTVLNELPIKERNRYYALEAKCATYGEYIHPNGTYSRARKDLQKKLSHPNSVDGSGRDAIVYSYTPTVDESDVEELFFNLQKKHREAQAELNSIKHAIDEKVTERNLIVNEDIRIAKKIYDEGMLSVMMSLKEWKLRETKRISELKIVVPDSLKPIYDEISKLGK